MWDQVNNNWQVQLDGGVEDVDRGSGGLRGDREDWDIMGIE